MIMEIVSIVPWANSNLTTSMEWSRAQCRVSLVKEELTPK